MTISWGRGSCNGSANPGPKARLAPPPPSLLHLQRLWHGAQVLQPRVVLVEPQVHVDVVDLGHVVQR